MLQLFKVLADNTRLRLLTILARGEFTVQELTAIFDMGQSRISRHLRILLDAGLLSQKRQGTWNYYRLLLKDPLWTQMWNLIESRLASLPESEKDLTNLSHVLEARRQRSRDFFDQHARQWDELARRLLSIPDYLRELISLVGSSDCVVEVGIGTGRLLYELHRDGRRLIGVDHSSAMLEEARAYLSQKGIAESDLRLGEMEHLPVRDDEADCVVLNMVLHHAPDPLAVLVEASRVLKPGGRLVLADLCKHSQEWVRESLADQWLGFEQEELDFWFQRAGLAPPAYVEVNGRTGQLSVLLMHARRIITN